MAAGDSGVSTGCGRLIEGRTGFIRSPSFREQEFSNHGWGEDAGLSHMPHQTGRYCRNWKMGDPTAPSLRVRRSSPMLLLMLGGGRTFAH
ncbi:hypothetical protein MPTK1_3g07570 [Marchantia polymorpha subsp. ruderalis]|uniref:Uncharacterized protein n=2 Tax=Marchantia polymorpha TaxID=3197 RepID=A0AAF6AYE8_MARPO|nr:hypothetical protein MARPO_0006s0232 [Marchantia polymorpha]BBN04782.1 hypothetical protein Mp_3g07570 [Marchantia polymorpha subsp. ruderalis]|eukprot:PTQ48226.1 hypothetical protein MARPO_0006s0232 [Marchantia polymorpha]